ncbi:MAG: hypothetical protein APR53_03005 [Methanoculleus sp. SDB]|nr:MAG: hypothetical protein APR53_03005 [Methanoculleus sp. SDB]
MIIALLAVCMLATPVLGAVPALDWQTTYGVECTENAFAMVPLGGGKILFCGDTGKWAVNTHPGAKGQNDLWLAEVGDDGSEIWDYCYGGTDDDSGRSIAATADGGWIIAGYTDSNDLDVSGNHGGRDAWVVKLNPDRTIAWQQCLGGTESDVARYVIQTSDGGYLVTGVTASEELTGHNGWEDGFVAKLLPDGTPDWFYCYGGENIDGLLDVIETSGGGYLIRGYTGSDEIPGYHGFWDLWILKITPSGALDWERCYGGSDLDINNLYDRGSGLIECADGYLVLADTKSTDGDVTGVVQGDADIWIVKIGFDGTILGQATLGGEGYETIGTIRPVSGGGYILVATTTSSGGDVSGNHGDKDIWVVRLAADYSIVWQKCLGGSRDEYGYDVLEMTPGTFELVGVTQSDDGDVTGYVTPTGLILTDAWIVRLANDGGGGVPVPEFPGILIPGALLGVLGCTALLLRRRP